MRIGLLMYGLERPLSGVTRVALELGKALRKRRDVEVVYLTTYGRGPFQDDDSCLSWHLKGCERLPALMLLGGPLITFAARKFNLDLVHDPIGIAPFPLGKRLAPFKRIVSLYDAIAYRYPESYPWLNNFLHRSYIPRMLHGVDAVITGTTSAREDLLRFLPVSDDQTHVVPCGIGEQFFPQPQFSITEVLAKYLLSAPFILTVSAWQPRKNIEGLLKAFSLLHQQLPEFKLVIAGAPLWSSNDLVEQIRSLGIEDAVVMPGYIDENDLPSLYSAANLFVFPSFYEGFGFPVLEAMACGTPVVCSDISSLPEVAGDAALLVDPHDTQAIAAGMARVLSNAELHTRMSEAGLNRAKRFTWDRAAEETVVIYERVLEEPGR